MDWGAVNSTLRASRSGHRSNWSFSFVAAISFVLTLPAMAFLPAESSRGAVATLHYAPNADFVAGSYAPGVDGFSLADIESADMLAELPPGVDALVYLGLCGGADAAFVSTVTPFLGDQRVFGFYLMDEPDPTGLYKPICPADDLKAESDWIHAHDPAAKTFITLMNMGSSSDPNYQDTYDPANSDIDLFGLDPYPCRSELGGCDDSYITKAVVAAEDSGIPQADVVPVFQAFGGGTFADDGGGQYSLPTPSQEQAILDTWASVVPDPVFDYTYSWGSQDADTALSTDPLLQPVLAVHNGVEGLLPTATTVTESTTSVVYGDESAALFNVTVTVEGSGPLQTDESVTVNVGSASCVAQLVSGSGSCTVADTALAVGGPYQLSATYEGDSTFSGSNGNGGTLTVLPVPTSTELTLARPSVSYGSESQVLSVTVGSASGTPTGRVLVAWPGGPICSTTLNQGTATCELGSTQLPGGTVAMISATYAGFGAFASSTSPTQSLTVAKDSTTTTLTDTPTSVSRETLSRTVFSVTVTTRNGEAVPDGETATVSVKSDACQVTLTQGKGTCELRSGSLAVGTYTAVATYQGDTNLLASRGSSPLRVTR